MAGELLIVLIGVAAVVGASVVVGRLAARSRARVAAEDTGPGAPATAFVTTWYSTADEARADNYTLVVEPADGSRPAKRAVATLSLDELILWAPRRQVTFHRAGRRLVVRDHDGHVLVSEMLPARPPDRPRC